jgi:hypothetical protein
MLKFSLFYPQTIHSEEDRLEGLPEQSKQSPLFQSLDEIPHSYER